MKRNVYLLVVAILIATALAKAVISLIGENPSNRAETPFILEHLKTHPCIVDKVGNVSGLQIDPGDWRISKSGGKIEGMYGVIVSGVIAQAKFRVYWESGENSGIADVYRITLVDSDDSKDIEVWTK